MVRIQITEGNIWLEPNMGLKVARYPIGNLLKKDERVSALFILFQENIYMSKQSIAGIIKCHKKDSDTWNFIAIEDAFVDESDKDRIEWRYYNSIEDLRDLLVKKTKSRKRKK